MEVYQETTETHKKKSKKDKEYNANREKDLSNIYKDYSSVHSSNQTLLGELRENSKEKALFWTREYFLSKRNKIVNCFSALSS